MLFQVAYYYTVAINTEELMPQAEQIVTIFQFLQAAAVPKKLVCGARYCTLNMYTFLIHCVYHVCTLVLHSEYAIPSTYRAIQLLWSVSNTIEIFKLNE
jgi:hypothetical protein